MAKKVRQSDEMADYFETLMKKRPEKDNGIIQLPMKNFITMVKLIKTEKDYEDCKWALY